MVVILGICAMAKKASSKPMLAILEHMHAIGDIKVVVFPEEKILEAPVEEWPHPVDVLISFYSDGFPLDKAEAYVALRRPHCINKLKESRVLLDRRSVHALLVANGIPTPHTVCVERDPDSGELTGLAAQDFSEKDDSITVGGIEMAKPFVEKPIDSEDHNIMIYYPSSAGGGAKCLFRKVGDRSSDFHPDVNQVRRDGSYMYEPFMKTGGTDIKVYTVGPDYAHAEARKSPVLDGVVKRDENGKEVRVPVVLTPKEKEMARRVCLAFGQNVCGFDMLRTKEGSFVIDVNGWSFVKGVPKYYEDAAAVLHAHMLHALGLPPLRRVTTLPTEKRKAETEGPNDIRERTDRWQHEELLAVLAVMRHGDRTPKNKMKLTTKRREFAELHRKWAGGPHKDAKLKSPKQLQEVLDLTFSMLGDHPPPKPGSPAQPSREGVEIDPNSAESGAENAIERCDSIDEKTTESLRLIRAVLEEGGHFDGIHRKVQLKPTAWNDVDEVEELIVVLKYGGKLTPAGVAQAEILGHRFRGEMYPSELDSETAAAPGAGHSNGLLRLHATQRHDFKVYSSDEGRVQMSAAAFTRGLLDLEAGSLTPICVALVETDPAMLDDLSVEAEAYLAEAKQVLWEHITGEHQSKSSVCTEVAGNSVNIENAGATTLDASGVACRAVDTDATASQEASVPCSSTSCIERVPEMLKEMLELKECVRMVCQQLEALDLGSVGVSGCGPDVASCGKKDKKQKKPEKSTGNKEIDHQPSAKSSLEPQPRGNADAMEAPSPGHSFNPLSQAAAEPVQTSKICSTTKPVLALKRWQKLHEDIWDAKRGNWNISKVPEIYDAVKYDLIHHPTLAPGFMDLYAAARTLNNVLVPNEYGSDEQIRAQTGATVCGMLLRKLLKDLRSSAGSGTPAEGLQVEKIVTAAQYLKGILSRIPRWLGGRRSERKDESVLPEDDDCREAEFIGADADHMNFRTPSRKVLTRLYFTSESHIQTLMNVLRYGHLVPKDRTVCEDHVLEQQPLEAGPSRAISSSSIGEEPRAAELGIVCAEAEERLRSEPVFDYLTQIVFRLYEDKRAPPGSAERHRVEVLFSPGASGHPTSACNHDHTMALDELRPLHAEGQPLTLTHLQQLIGAVGAAKGPSSKMSRLISNKGL